jgi:hypothetical protein
MICIKEYFLGAMSSIIILADPRPYTQFTQDEWEKIPYRFPNPIIPQSIFGALLEATRKHVSMNDNYMYAEQPELSRAAACTFNDL